MRSRKPKVKATGRGSRRRAGPAARGEKTARRGYQTQAAARGALSRAAAERIADHGYKRLLEEGFSKEIAEQYRRETIADLMKPVGA